MPLDVNIDDNNTTLIQYQGAWTYISGSTRQWEGGVHTTGQAGASATFNFRGYRVWVLGTIPAGSGTNAIMVSIDGDTSSTITRTSNGSANYDEVYFASSSLRDTSHTIVVTNRGSTASGNSEFMLDRFEFQTDDEVPTFPAFASSTSVSSSTSSVSTRTSSPSTNTSPSLPSSNSTIPWGAVIGGTVSGLVVIAILLFVLWRKRRSSKLSKDTIPSPSTSNPTPFPAASELPTHGTTNRRLLPTLLPEKSSYQRIQQHHQPSVEPTNAPTNAPTTSIRSSSGAVASGSSPIPAGPLFVEPDFPPPSYEQNPTAS